MAAQAQTAEQQEYEWLTVYRSYARDQLFIQPMPDAHTEMTGGTQLSCLDFNDPQVVLDGVINDIKSSGRLLRLIILKARREGVSTYIAGRDYWMTSTRFNRYALLITHEPEATEFLFQMHKRFYQHNPIGKPHTTYNNKRLLTFDTPDGKGLGSAVRVATAGKEHIGSGTAIHYLHLSEMAKWPAHTTEAIMTSVMQAVPKSPDTEVIIESTAAGMGGEFYDRYWGSRYQYNVVLDEHGKPKAVLTINKKTKESNEFSSIFLPWFIFETYTMPVPAGFERTEEEDEMMNTYGLTDGKLVWRRWCIENNCNGLIEIFKQEYPSNPEEAFLSSGTPVFDMNQLAKLRDTAMEPKARYRVRMDDGQFVAEADGDFLVWEEPRVGETYVIPADVAEGIDRNVSGRVADFSAMGVFKCSNGEQVAEWHGKIDADLMGVLMIHVGKRYNTGWLVPERNNHGNATVLKIAEMKYPKIYVERVPEPPNKIRKRFGWLTTRINKSDIVDNMLAEMRDGTHGLKSKELFNEMMTFKKDGLKYEADTNKFDDRVMYAMIGKFVLPRLRPRQLMRDARDLARPSDTVGSEPPVGAWMI